MRKAFVDGLLAEAELNPELYLLVADVGFGLVEPFQQRFPERFLNVGIAEQNLISVAAGLALAGKTVVAYSLANFISMRCLEQIRNDVCYHQANVKLICSGGGLSYGPLGYSHHTVEDLAALRPLPSLTLVAPGDPQEAFQATRALLQQKGPAYLRLARSNQAVHAEGIQLQLGRALEYSAGQDLTLVATGEMLPGAVQLAERLRRERQLRAGVLSMHTIKPLDTVALRKAAAATGRLVTLEEHVLAGGLGSAVAEWLVDEDVDVKLLRLGLLEKPATVSGSQDFLRGQHGMDQESLFQAIVGRFFQGVNPHARALH